MARVEKYKSRAVIYALRHNSRECPQPPSNSEIDISRSHLNYSLGENGNTASECQKYYRKRLSELYVYGKGKRQDVNTLCQWVISAPKDLAKDQEHAFFQAANDYCNSLYGAENSIQCTVHYDEGIRNQEGELIAGRPHLHYSFIPAIKNDKYLRPNRYSNSSGSALYKEKCSANDVLTRSHLQCWHKGFQKFLVGRGIICTVMNGSTIGKGKTVEQLKSATKDEMIKELQVENASLKSTIHDLKNSKERTSWSHSKTGWSKGTKKWEKEF